MKKFLSLFLAIPMLAMMASCDDDNEKNIPDVSVSIEYSGGEMVDGVLTVEQGTDLVIDALKVTPAPGTGEATLGNTVFYLNGLPFFATGVAPHSCVISTTDLPLGDYTLSVHAQIYQVDKSIGFGTFRYTMRVVAPTTDPSDPDSGTDSGSGSGSDTPALVITDTDPAE
ncbi:MAG: hypothetical protein HDR97_05925 [Bacteroides sp.]|nr:hypothetical protein [Bacteroides sp.]MBD5271584.1 hypothetical protein [Bacteroides sp.]MBD5333256.1 hypothetical protein [Bacteroides sp.]